MANFFSEILHALHLDIEILFYVYLEQKSVNKFIFILLTVIWFPWNLEIGDWSAIGEDTLIYNLGRVVIGKKATISHRTHICAGTHDYTNPTLPLLRPEIHIGDQAWICANAFIGPNTHIGEGAIIGAGTVLMKDAEAWGIYAGNPAKYIKKRILS